MFPKYSLTSATAKSQPCFWVQVLIFPVGTINTPEAFAMPVTAGPHLQVSVPDDSQRRCQAPVGKVALARLLRTCDPAGPVPVLVPVWGQLRSPAWNSDCC